MFRRFHQETDITRVAFCISALRDDSFYVFDDVFVCLFVCFYFCFYLETSVESQIYFRLDDSRSNTNI